ncbi:MAG TPA: YraN family protein [Chloroflexota bacterium]|nr:YraN family protein [Chloroflexota bacterium]
MIRRVGAFGEAWTCGYLTRRGYRIIERNVRLSRGEIDIVASQGDALVFVEVKTRRSRAFGSPQSSITHARYRRLANAVEEYLSARGLEPARYRIDVVALELGPSGDVIHCELIENAEDPAG